MDDADTFEAPYGLRYSAWVRGAEGEVRLLVALEGFHSSDAAQLFLGELIGDDGDRTVH